MIYESVNPFTEQRVKQYANHTDEQAFAALAKADAAYRSGQWGRGPIDNRLKVLARIAELFEERVEELARAATSDMGKRIADARGEVKLCGGIARYYAEQAKTLLQPVPYPATLGEAWVEYQPVGTLVAVEPWNFPYYQLIRVVAPAIAVGNSVLLKHSENVPHCAELFEKLVRDAGAPEGACVNLYISPEQVAALIADDRVQGVALTGSERAGAAVAATASQHLKKSTLELGGSDIFAVLDDADLAKAVKLGAAARLRNAGQVCTSAKRFILHEKIAPAFLAELKRAFAAMTPGDPLDEATTLQPLSSRKALDILSKQVEEAIAKGAKVEAGGQRIDSRGFFFEPTILTRISRDNPAYYQEFFGPVAQVYVVKSDEELIALANDSRFGLGGMIFSQNIERAKRLASQIETGMVYINSVTGTAPDLPFGGIKRSGFGRELSDLGLLEFVNKKLVVVAKAS